MASCVSPTVHAITADELLPDPTGGGHRCLPGFTIHPPKDNVDRAATKALSWVD